MKREALAARSRLYALLHDEHGATAIEYGLIVGAIALAILASVFALGSELNVLFVGVEADVGEQVRCVEVDSSCMK